MIFLRAPFIFACVLLHWASSRKWVWALQDFERWRWGRRKSWPYEFDLGPVRVWRRPQPVKQREGGK